MSGLVKNILILGGGSAGWLTAGILASELRESITITLVESPSIPTIGVGEGTWPSMRDTLSRIGISEKEFLVKCDVSFKQGSKFKAWCTGNPEEFYYHPFSIPEGFFEANCIPQWQARSSTSFASALTAQESTSERFLAPKQIGTPDYAAVANYGYHLDAGKFGLVLKEHCTNNLGVNYICDHVARIESQQNGDIKGLHTKSSGLVEADLFIDCSGSNSLLLQQHYGLKKYCRRHQLFNDKAIAVQVPYPCANTPIASATISTAQKAGWIWDIGLPTRRGVGHVYSSAHMDDQTAESLLREYLLANNNSSTIDTLNFRQLSFEPSHLKQFWYKNAVAVGMASGFIEPLEASALALVEMSANRIRDDFPATKDLMPVTAKRFNESFNYKWDRVIEFLKLHYILSSRNDTTYWRDHKDPASIPERLQELIELWRFQSPSRRDFQQNDEVFPAASYQFILYGMGFKTNFDAIARSSNDNKNIHHYFQKNADWTKKLLQSLPSNRDLLNTVQQRFN